MDRVKKTLLKPPKNATAKMAPAENDVCLSSLGLGSGSAPRPVGLALPDREQSDDDGAAAETDPGPPGPAVLLTFHQRHEQQKQAGREQAQSDRIEAAPGACRGRRQQPGRHRDRYHTDDQVDQKHPAPPVVCPGDGDDHTAEQRSHRGGHADDGAEHPECLGPGCAGERVLDGRADCGEEQAGPEALHDSGGDDLSLRLRDAAADAGQDEDRQPEQERRLMAEPVVGPATGYQGEPVGQHVAGHDPFQARGRRMQAGADAGQGDVHDRGVEEEFMS
jgi:hypothetical protein